VQFSDGGANENFSDGGANRKNLGLCNCSDGSDGVVSVV